MSSNKEIYNEELFVELNCEEDMKIFGGDSIFQMVSVKIDSVLASVKEKLFG